MTKQSMGATIATLRKERGMTQLDLAEKMGVTDKAVSKWERDLSCPDIGSLPRLAEIFGISVDELMQSAPKTKAQASSTISPAVPLVLKAVALAMGVAVTVLTILNQVDAKSAVGMLGIGLACLSLTQFFSETSE